MRITKQILRDNIEKTLKNNPSIRVNVKDISKLRNGRWGFHPYEIGFCNTVKSIMVYPWAGSIAYWVFDSNKLNKDELLLIQDRINLKLK